MLKRQAAQAMAKKDGESRLETVKKGEDKLVWGASKSLSRMDSRLIPPVAVPAVFKMDTGKLPAYTGVELPGVGYALFKLNKVSAGEKLDEARLQSMLKQLASLNAQEEVQLYLASLRSRYKVVINPSALEAK
jgi:peptidyl-prolyl cis-trans isomerase D